MKTTLELSFDEICLICDMARTYTRHLDEHIEFNKKMNLPTDWSVREIDKTYNFWEKIEKNKTAMIRGTK